MWYQIDDDKSPVLLTAEYIMKEEQGTAYTFFYRKIQGPVTREVADLFIDTYGTDFGKTAVAFSLPLCTETGNPTRKCLNIIDKFKQFFEENPNKTIIDFIKLNKTELHFWRHHTKDQLCYDSCVPNGTCGFQLDFLLHERLSQQDNTLERDYYIKIETKHITTPEMMKDFILHIKNKAYGKPPYPYFPDIIRPIIEVEEENKNSKKKANKSTKPIQKISKPNTYKSYEDWIYHRWRLSVSKQIEDKTYAEELTYYKYREAAEWIINNQGKNEFKSRKYPKTTRIKDLTIKLWFGVNMFNFCKQDHKFSVFYNTKNIQAPYIPDHYALCYSSTCEEPSFKYTFEDVLEVTDDLNHGALDENEHFFLFETMLFNNSFRKGLGDYTTNLKHVLKYGKFDIFVKQDFARFGMVAINRAYNFVEDYNAPVPVKKVILSGVIDIDDDEPSSTPNNILLQKENIKDLLEYDEEEKEKN